ncbi:MAG: Hpt domain-containing protein, partial [Burkholderiaceae bacterium]|nr:Hpt domain-containing protein [Burkholderiaceae bacterium]
RDVQELAGAQRIHPADLWEAPADAQRQQPVAGAPAGVTPLQVGPAIRAQFDRYVLHIMKSQHPVAAGYLKRVSAGLAAGAASPRLAGFWQLAAAYFEAIELGLLPSDMYVKRAASRVLLQYTAQAQGSPDVNAALRHDLMFFVAQARRRPEVTAPWLDAVRAGMGIAALPDTDYDAPTLGRYDPAHLVQARKRINSAKEGWSLLTGGDAAKARQVADQFSLVRDSLDKILPVGAVLGQSLVRAAEHSHRSGQAPSAELGMETATALLYVEAVLQDMEASDPTLPQRMAQIAQRVEQALSGVPSSPLEGWMEDLYRRVSDRQTMGSVVGELKVTLGDLEGKLDDFVRNPADKGALAKVPQQLSQMRGVLSVLGLDHASHAVTHMLGNVEGMLADEVDPDRAREAGTFSHLAHNLSALSFLIDMLNYQPVLARKLFVFDARTGELNPLMGRTTAPSEPTAAQATLSASLSDVVDAVTGTSDDHLNVAELTRRLDVVAQEADLSESPALATAAREAASEVAAGDPQAGAQALSRLVDLVEEQPEPPAPAPVSSVPQEPIEDDLLDIFLEEARDVIQAGWAASAALGAAPHSMPDMTTLRRAFHTLKGSSRMVGLTEFGEAAWAMEQLMNGWLAESKPASADLCKLCSESLERLGQWVEDIAQHSSHGWSAAPFQASSLAMRQDGVFLPWPDAAALESPEPDATPPTDPSETASPETPPATAAGGAASVAETVDGAESPEATASIEGEEVLSAGHEADLDLDLDFGFDLGPDPVQTGALEVQSSASAEPHDEPDSLPEAEPAIAAAWRSAAVGEGLSRGASPEFAATEFAATQFTDAPVLGDLPLAPDGAERDTGPAGPDAFDFDLDFPADWGDEQPVPQTALADGAIVADSPLPEPLGVGDAAASESDELVGVELGADALDEFFSQGASDEGLRWEPEPVPEPATADAPLEVVEPVAHEAPAADVAPRDSEPQAEMFAEPEPVPEDEVKVIGSLRIGIKLFNVYLNEADEWSRRLSAELGDWALDCSAEAVPKSAEALAHSLAGASGAVGFSALSDLARALEHALGASHAHAQDGMPASASDAALFVNAADDIRRLLHQFAAGFLKEASASVMQQLDEFLHQRQTAVAAAPAPADLDEAPDGLVEGLLTPDALNEISNAGELAWESPSDE